MTSTAQSIKSLDMMLRALRLPSFFSCHEETAINAERQGWSFGQYLHHLCELELADREKRRIDRFSKQSELLQDKTLERFDDASRKGHAKMGVHYRIISKDLND